MANFIEAYSADEAYHTFCRFFNRSISGGFLERLESRNGLCYRFPRVFVTEYLNPERCVVTDVLRNANPFLHLAEFCWFIAGRNDLDYITKFAPNMKNYSDDGVTIPASYGHRWRSHFVQRDTYEEGFDPNQTWAPPTIDQLKDVVNNLIKDPASRRELIVMWDPSVDVYRKNNGGKDVPCNFAMKFSVRQGKLNMTVFSRSQDAIFGKFGANVAHFSLTHMLVAAAANLPIGIYTQVADDLHVYGAQVYRSLSDSIQTTNEDGSFELKYRSEPTVSSKTFSEFLSPSVKYVENKNSFTQGMSLDSFYDQLQRLVNDHNLALRKDSFSDPFIANVVAPMLYAYLEYYKKENDPVAAVKFLKNQRTLDVNWVSAGVRWMERVVAKRNAKEGNANV